MILYCDGSLEGRAAPAALLGAAQLRPAVNSSCIIAQRTSVPDPDPNPDLDPLDPHVFVPPRSGSGSTSQRYGSGSG